MMAANDTVTVLYLGPTDTRFRERDNQTTTRLLYLLGWMDPQTVAQAGCRDMLRGRHLVVPGFQDKLMVFFRRLGPRSLWSRIVEWLHQRRGDGS